MLVVTVFTFIFLGLFTVVFVYLWFGLLVGPRNQREATKQTPQDDRWHDLEGFDR